MQVAALFRLVRSSGVVGIDEPEEQPHLRKCPLELAGYDLARVPLAHSLRDTSRGTVPLTRSAAQVEVVPKSKRSHRL